MYTINTKTTTTVHDVTEILRNMLSITDLDGIDTDSPEFIPNLPSPLLRALTRWMQGDLNKTQRTEKLIHLLILDAAFLRPDNHMDYERLYLYLEQKRALKRDLYARRTWQEAIAPLAEFFHCPSDFAWYQVRFQSSQLTRWSDASDLVDRELVELMDFTRLTMPDQEHWRFVVEFTYLGSQNTVVDIQVRERMFGEEANITFRPRS